MEDIELAVNLPLALHVSRLNCSYAQSQYTIMVEDRSLKVINFAMHCSALCLSNCNLPIPTDCLTVNTHGNMNMSAITPGLGLGLGLKMSLQFQCCFQELSGGWSPGAVGDASIIQAQVVMSYAFLGAPDPSPHSSDALAIHTTKMAMSMVWLCLHKLGFLRYPGTYMKRE